MSLQKYAAVAICACAAGYLLRSAPDRTLTGQGVRYEFEKEGRWPGAMFRVDKRSGEMVFCWIYQGAPQRAVMIPRDWKSDPEPSYGTTLEGDAAINKDIFDAMTTETDPLGDPGAKDAP